MTIRTAVIGVGAMGRHHARVLSDMAGAELVGVADIQPSEAEENARRYHCPAFDSVQHLLDEASPDAVLITVPTVYHLEVALQVIERGIPLLVEKPIAFSVGEGQAMIEAAARAGVTLMVGHIERFNPAVMALKAHLAAAELGRVFQIDARRQGPFPARVQDVGVVIDLAVHDLDVMRFVTGAEVSRVFAETERRIHSSREDLLSGLVRLDDGTVGTLTVNWLTPTKIRELYVTGELGMFRVDYLTQDLFFFENGTTPVGEWPFRMLRGVSEGRMIRHVVPKKEPLRAELEAFLAAVRGERPVAVTGQDGLRALELAQAIVSSGLEHRAIVLSS
jgi:predicted dehydrogenase